MNTFTKSYIKAALWSSTDGDTPLDRNYSISDIAPEALAQMEADSVKFQGDNGNDLGRSGIEDALAGSCFWLDRNGHGSGFWDEDSISEKYRKSLSDAAKACGESGLYVGGDGMIYVSPMTASVLGPVKLNLPGKTDDQQAIGELLLAIDTAVARAKSAGLPLSGICAAVRGRADYAETPRGWDSVTA